MSLNLGGLNKNTLICVQVTLLKHEFYNKHNCCSKLFFCSKIVFLAVRHRRECLPIFCLKKVSSHLYLALNISAESIITDLHVINFYNNIIEKARRNWLSS